MYQVTMIATVLTYRVETWDWTGLATEQVAINCPVNVHCMSWLTDSVKGFLFKLNTLNDQSPWKDLHWIVLILRPEAEIVGRGPSTPPCAYYPSASPEPRNSPWSYKHFQLECWQWWPSNILR
jgi:hypothetical protein